MKSLATAIEWKLKKLDQWKNQISIATSDGILIEWIVTGFLKPDTATLQSWCDEYQATGINEKADNKNQAITNVKGKLKISDADLSDLKTALSSS